jgi:probable rRNA maturation factor
MNGITLVVEDLRWRAHRGLRARLKEAAQAACRRAHLRGDFTILLAGDKKLRALNHDFRGLDAPTNVLSFLGGSMNGRTPGRSASVAAPGYAGDIAIAYGVAAREAKAAGKTLADHAVHLAVHGVLHLAGYDHERMKDACVMEPLETRILARLGVADPYAPAPSPKKASQ